MKNAEEWNMMFEQQSEDETNQRTAGSEHPSMGVTIIEAGPSYAWYQRQHRRKQYKAALVALLCNLWWVILISVACYWFPIVTASATITLVPSQKTISVSTKLSLREEPTPSLNEHPVVIRTLPTLTVSQTVLVSASTIETHTGALAHGLVTFHNQSWSQQIVGKGTTLVAQNGEEVVTDEDAVIPGAAPTRVGWATVHAHAKQVGFTGNLALGTLRGTCCLPSISYINFWSFVGGSPATAIPTLHQNDIDHTLSHIQSSLMEVSEVALHSQILQNETLLTFPSCTFSHMQPRLIHQNNFLITASEICQPLITIRTSEVVTSMTFLLTQYAYQHYDTHAQLIGKVHITVLECREMKPGVFSLLLAATGTWQFIFTPTQLEAIRRVSAGQTQDIVLHRLQKTHGISNVHLTVSGLQQHILPIDPNRITVIVRREGS